VLRASASREEKRKQIHRFARPGNPYGANSAPAGLAHDRRSFRLRKIHILSILLLTVAAAVGLLRTEAGVAKSQRHLLYMTLSAGFHHESVPLSTESR